MCIKGYCVELVKPLAEEGTGEVIKVVEGTMYALDQNESHHLRGGKEECHLICVFSPPCTGDEKQGPDGSFELLEYTIGVLCSQYDQTVKEIFSKKIASCTTEVKSC